MINIISAQLSQTFSVGIRTLPTTLVTFELTGPLNSSSVLQDLSESDDSFKVKRDGKAEIFAVSRLLNDISIFPLMSFIGPMYRKVKVSIGDEKFGFRPFRGVMYKYCADPNTVWADDLGASFHSGSTEDIEFAKGVFDHLQNARIDK